MIASHLNELERFYKEINQSISQDFEWLFYKDLNLVTLKPVVLENTQVPKDEVDLCHASQTLPKDVYLKKAIVSGSTYGVWSKTEIPKGVRFGPYEGINVYNEDEANKTGYYWQILKEKYIDYFVSGENENESNWLRYINLASNQGRQNLVALKHDGQIYYETTRKIPSETQLLVWYEDEYANELETEKKGNGNICKVRKKNKVQQKNKNSFSASKTKKKDLSKTSMVCTCKETNVINHGLLSASEAKKKDLPKTSAVDLCKKAKEMIPTTSSGTVNADKNLRTDLKEKEFIYKKTIENNPERQDHLQKSAGQKHSVSNLCEKDSVIKKLTHTQKGEKPYTCNACGKGFTRKYELKAHHKTHTEIKLYICDLCGTIFKAVYEFELHFMFRHPGEMPYPCDVCNKRVIDKDALRRHKYEHRIREKMEHLCDVCGKTFAKKRNMKEHLRVHTGEKPYKCDFCGKTSAKKQNMQQHLLIHTNEKPYKCDLCGNRFASKQGFNHHMRAHRGERPHVCNVCGKSFPHKSKLSRHLIIHTGE